MVPDKSLRHLRSRADMLTGTATGEFRWAKGRWGEVSPAPDIRATSIPQNHPTEKLGGLNEKMCREHQPQYLVHEKPPVNFCGGDCSDGSC